MGVGGSVEPKPAPDNGYVFRIAADAKPWTPAAKVRESSSARCAQSRRRAAKIGGWSKARYAVMVAISQAGSEREIQRPSFGEENGWIAKELSIKDACSLNHFDVGRVVGRGAMGEVSLARIKKDGTFVALKVVSKSYVTQHNHERHVQNERRILGGMQHPFVVSLFATFQDEKHLYFVLEYVPGGELFSKIRGNQCLAVEPAKFYLAEIFAAVAHVHDRGYAYRDLKPENVLLDAEGHCRLIDFGFARVPPTDSGLMLTNVGTPAYMSPEQLSRKKTGGYTRVVDWWAFGCVSFELMTGRTPFSCKNHDDSHHAIYLRVMRGKVSFPSFVSRQPRDFVRELLKPDVNKRLVTTAAIKAHAFFATVDFKAVSQRRAVPPTAVGTLPPGDASHFDVYHHRRRDRRDNKDPRAADGSTTRRCSSFRGF
ncbi:hypothetical protein CTAYLR_007461 [Chrysophaeum taylorii]|uniref:Protein kinase domain-containing protein n=1 Tax=Chrysophaeum taylorii TaxID=2483200 RepID=A0AAD7XKH1_9STRA|nr:hypothetical protein CTAYLR_007461 [Chrysophaeum taylorii]